MSYCSAFLIIKEDLPGSVNPSISSNLRPSVSKKPKKKLAGCSGAVKKNMPGKDSFLREAHIRSLYNTTYKETIMAITVEGKMVNGRTILLEHPLANGQEEVLVRLKKRPLRTKIHVPEQFVMEIADRDIEELS